MPPGGGLSVGNLTAFLGLNTSAFVQGMAQADSAMARAGRSMQNMGRAMTSTITLPLLAISGASIKMGMNFEKVFSEIEGLVGESKEQVQEFKKEIMKMSPEISRPPQELAEALRFVTSSGFKGAAALEIVDQAGRASAAGLGQTQDIADLVTAALNAYGSENLTAAEAVDTLTAAVREGKAEGQDMAHALGFVMPVASQMGVEFEEVSAAVAAMTRSMKSGSGGASTAATNLRQLLSDLLDPSQQARDAMEQMGTSASKLRQAIKEEGLLSVLGFFKDQLQNNEEAITSIFPNVKALTGVLQLVGENADEVKQVFADLKDNTGDMAAAFDIASQGSTFKFNQGMAELKVAAIQLGEALIPIFLDLVGVVRDMATWFTSLDHEGKRMVIMLAAAAAAAGPLLMIMGSLAVAIAAITWEVVAVVGALGALAAGFIYVYENWEAVKERISDWNWWKNLLIDMANFLIRFNPMAIGTTLMLRVWNHFAEEITKSLNSLILKFNLFLANNGMTSFLGKIDSAELANPFDLMSEGLENLKDDTTEYKHQFGTFTDAIASFADKAKKAIMGMFPQTGPSGGGKAGESQQRNTSGVVSQGNYQPPPTWGKDWWDETEWGIKKTRIALDQLNNAVEHALTDTFVKLGEVMADIFTGKANPSDFFKSLVDIIANFLGALGKALIAAGVASEAFKDLLANPYAAIAAGVGLMIAAGVVRNMLKSGPSGASNTGGGHGTDRRGGSIQGMAVGGYVTSGGVFQLHKDELVSLPAGSAVTPAHMAMGGGDGSGGNSIQGTLRGYQIELLLKKERYRRATLG